jgi:membrane glycosyltransferase
VIDALMRPEARRRYGGGRWFLVNVLAETVFFLMLSPIMWFAHTVFLATLIFGGSVGWGGQARDDHAVPLSLAWAKLWPQTALGGACLGALALAAPAAVPVSLLIAGGLAFAVPLCVITAKPAVGAALLRAGIGQLPEEIMASPLDALALPALKKDARRERQSPPPGGGRSSSPSRLPSEDGKETAGGGDGGAAFAERPGRPTPDRLGRSDPPPAGEDKRRTPLDRSGLP